MSSGGALVWIILLSPIFHFDRGNNGCICQILCVKLLGNKFFILEAALLVFGLCHVFLKVAYFKRLHSYCWWTKIACKSKVEIVLEQRKVAFLSSSKICENLNFTTEIQIFANFLKILLLYCLLALFGFFPI